MGKGKRKEKKERKEEKKEKKRKKRKEIEEKQKGEEEEQCVEERRKKKKKERHFPSQSPANRRSKLVGARGKVGLRDKGYTWVPKFEFFVKVPKGRGFSYTSYFLPSDHVRDILVQLYS